MWGQNAVIAHMRRDHIPFGIALMIGFCLVAPFADAMAKILSVTFSVVAILFVRFGAQAILLMPFLFMHGVPKLDSWQWVLMTLRTLLHLGGVALMFVALRHLPLADAIAIAYVMPFIALFLGWLTLGEAVGARRLVACCAGFVGTLLVVQPSFVEVGALALLPLGVAVFFAGYMLVTRMLVRDEDPIVLQAISGIQGSALLALFCVFAPETARLDTFQWPPQLLDAVMLALLTVTGTLGHVLMAWSLRFAPSATVAPVQYLEIPVAVVYGWLLFGQYPNLVAVVGIAITMGAGIYVVLCERDLADLRRSDSSSESP